MRWLRLLKIVTVSLRFGLDQMLIDAGSKLRFAGLLRVTRLGRRFDAPRAVRLRQALEALGPIFVKFGQMLSTRRDLLPPDLADELAKLSGLTLITNSFDVALKVGAAGSGANELIMLGGSVGGPVCATAGDITIAEIHRYRADVALLSPVGVDAECGATSYDLREAEVARAMAANAKQRILLADFSKIGLCSRVSYCEVNRIDHLITNTPAQKQPAFAALKAAVGKVLVA